MLEFKDVEVRYSNIILALKGVTLEVSEGSIVSILGSNGAGKTTILKAISGLLALGKRPGTSRGEIFFEGRRVDGMDPAKIARSGISLVMEGRALFRSLTVEENLQGGQPHAQRRQWEKVRDDLETVLKFFPWS